MNFLFSALALLLALLLPPVQAYMSTVLVDNLVINSQTTYTFTFTSLPDNSQRSVLLSFPASSDFVAANVAVFVNNNANSLASGSYVADPSTKRITINNQVPVGNSLTFRITNIINPPSV